MSALFPVAYAQSSPTCATNAVSPRTIRVEGRGELVADIVVTCTGGTPTVFRGEIPTYTFTLTSNAIISSRTLGSGTFGAWSEALLLVDEPAPANLLMCDSISGICPMGGNGTGVGTYSGAPGQYNVFQGVQSDFNVLTFLDVPFDAPGSGTRTFRFTNVRVDATSLEIPSAISLSVAVSPAIPISNPIRTVANSLPSISAFAESVTFSGPRITSFDAVVSELQSNVFKTRTAAPFEDNDTSPDPTNQNVVGTVYNTETGFFDQTRFTSLPRSAVNLAGLADTGTRIAVYLGTFSPDNVTVTVPEVVNLTSTSGNTGVARLLGDVSFEGLGSFNVSSDGDLLNQEGVAWAIYEVLSTNPSVLETLRIPVTFSYTLEAPPVTAINGHVSLAPFSLETFNYFPLFDSFVELTVRNLPTITTTSLPAGNVGSAYNAQMTGAGGTSPYSWSATGLPPGLTMTNAGQIVGTPTVAGSFPVSITITDVQTATANASLVLNVVSPLQFLTSSPLPDGLVFAPYQTTFFASGGTSPYRFSLFGQPVPGLTLSESGVLSGTPTTQGVFVLPVQVLDQSGQNVIQEYRLAIRGNTPNVKPTMLTMEFKGSVGGDKPPAQSLALVSLNQRNGTFALNLDSGGGNAARRAAAPTWLIVSLDQGVVPARLTVGTDPAGLIPGTYTARITISQPGDPSQAPIIVDVTFQVTSSNPILEVVPDGLEFSATRQAPAPQTKTIGIRNTGGGGSIPFAASVVGRARWITRVTPLAGATVRDNVQLMTVDIDPSGLAVGQYRDVIRITSTARNVEIPVSLFISEGGPVIDLSLSGVQFRTTAGSSLPTSRDVKVINRGDANTVVRWTAQKVTGGDWLTLVNSTGTATPGNPGTLSLKLAASAGSRPAGSEYALIKVTDAASAGSPQYLLAVLDVGSSPAQALLDLQTAGIVFLAPPFSTTPLTQKVGFSVSSNTPVAYLASAAAESNGSWLSVSPNAGAVSAGQLTELTITANAATLPAGVYRGEVVIGRGDTVRAINVTFIVSDQAAAASELSSSARSATCSPKALVLTSTGMPNHFQVPAGWPATLTAQLYDDCGRPVSNASVVASFTNGDAPLTLLSDGNTGSYSGTWEPGTALTNVNVTLRATAAGLTPSAPLIIGDVTQNSVPKITKNGTLHNLNPQVLGALSPGVVAQIYGENLANVTESTTSVPLATSYKGTRVLVGEYEAPLYFVSPTQLVVQFPAEVKPNTPVSVVVQAPGGITVPEQITVVDVKPGVAAFPDGRLIAQHANFSLVDANNPARPGEVLTIYLVGMGATNPPVPSGTRSPGAEPFGRPLITPTVTVGGQNANVVFAGLTPFGIGLFQINFAVPVNAPTGVPLDVVISQGNEQANVTTLTIVK